MNIQDKSKLYPASAYNENLTLKPSLSLWLVILFLLWPYVITLISLANMSNHTELIRIVYANEGELALAEVASLPAVLVFAAWIRRHPDAGEAIRWIWRHGRGLLIAAGILNFIMAIAPVFWRLDELGFANILQTIMSVYVLLYLWRSDRTRDTFLDFPLRLDK